MNIYITIKKENKIYNIYNIYKIKNSDILFLIIIINNKRVHY